MQIIATRELANLLDALGLSFQASLNGADDTISIFGGDCDDIPFNKKITFGTDIQVFDEDGSYIGFKNDFDTNEDLVLELLRRDVIKNCTFDDIYLSNDKRLCIFKGITEDGQHSIFEYLQSNHTENWRIKNTYVITRRDHILSNFYELNELLLDGEL